MNSLKTSYTLLSQNKLLLGFGTTITLIGIATSSQAISLSPNGTGGNTFAVLCLGFLLVTLALFVLIIVRQVQANRKTIIG
jgi:hypothetical protein